MADVRLDLVELPPGFSIDIYAEDVENARQMVRGDQGTIFAGSRKAGKLFGHRCPPRVLLYHPGVAVDLY